MAEPISEQITAATAAALATVTTTAGKSITLTVVRPEHPDWSLEEYPDGLTVILATGDDPQTIVGPGLEDRQMEMAVETLLHGQTGLALDTKAARVRHDIWTVLRASAELAALCHQLDFGASQIIIDNDDAVASLRLTITATYRQTF